jgi:hypothetical protein
VVLPDCLGARRGEVQAAFAKEAMARPAAATWPKLVSLEDEKLILVVAYDRITSGPMDPLGFVKHDVPFTEWTRVSQSADQALETGSHDHGHPAPRHAARLIEVRPEIQAGHKQLRRCQSGAQGSRCRRQMEAMVEGHEIGVHRLGQLLLVI